MRKSLIILVWSILFLTGCSSVSKDGATEDVKEQECSPILIDECLQFFDKVQYGDYIFTINDEFDIYYEEADCGIVLGSAIPGTGKPVLVSCENFQGGEAVTVSIANAQLYYHLVNTSSDQTTTYMNQLLSKNDNYLCIASEGASFLYLLSGYD